MSDTAFRWISWLIIGVIPEQMFRFFNAIALASSVALLAVYIDINHRSVRANPPAISAPLLTQRHTYSVGSTVDVLWNGQWYPAMVRAVRGPGQWLITYIGYSSAWDEVVGSDRIRLHQGQSAPSSPNPGNTGGNYPPAPSCGFGSTCGAVPLSPNPTGLFGTGTW